MPNGRFGSNVSVVSNVAYGGIAAVRALYSVPANLLKLLSPNSHAKFLNCPRDRD